MKRILSILALFGLLFVLPQTKVKAEEITEPETTETETPKDEIEIKDVEEIVKGIVKEIAEKYFGNYADKQLIADIVVIASAVITYLIVIGVNIKYGKYKKGGVTEIIDSFKKVDANHLENSLKTAYKKIDTLEKLVIELKESHETMMKVFVLSQDKSAEGKVAMLDYLGNHTQNSEVQEKAQEISEELVKEVEVKQEVNEKVKDEYQEIF